MIRGLAARPRKRRPRSIRLVRKLDPPGVALAICVSVCFPTDAGNASHDVLRTLIGHHLDDLQHNRLPAIEKKTGFPIETIKEALSTARLDPEPGSVLRHGQRHPICRARPDR